MVAAVTMLMGATAQVNFTVLGDKHAMLKVAGTGVGRDCGYCRA